MSLDLAFFLVDRISDQTKQTLEKGGGLMRVIIIAANEIDRAGFAITDQGLKMLEIGRILPEHEMLATTLDDS